MMDAEKSAAELYSDMWDANVRFEESWPFPSDPPSREMIDAFEMAWDNLPPQIQALIKNWPEADRDALADGDREMFNELSASAHRAGLYGWVGTAATPVMTPTGENSAYFSWGHYHTQMLFADSGEALLKAAIEWAEEQKKADYAKRVV